MEYGTIDQRFVDYTEKPAISLSVLPIQTIERAQANQDATLMKMLDFLVPSAHFLLLCLAGMGLWGLARWSFAYFKRVGSNLRIKILSFFALLFLWWIGEFFNGNLNTTNVLSDTSDLLYSKEQLIQTKREFCFLEQSSELDVFKKVITNHYQIFDYRSKTSPEYEGSHI